MDLSNLLKKTAVDVARLSGAKVERSEWDMVCPICGEPTKDGRKCAQCLQAISEAMGVTNG